MLQSKTTETGHSKNVSPLPGNIPITYIWYGKSIPEDYLISLSELRYPFNFIKDAELDRKFSLYKLWTSKSLIITDFNTSTSMEEYIQI